MCYNIYKFKIKTFSNECTRNFFKYNYEDYLLEDLLKETAKKWNKGRKIMFDLKDE